MLNSCLECLLRNLSAAGVRDSPRETFNKHSLAYTRNMSSQQGYLPNSKELQLLINAEKVVVVGINGMDHNMAIAADALSAWAKLEDPEVADVVCKVASLFKTMAGAQKPYAEAMNAYRNLLKNMRDREAEIKSLNNDRDKIANALQKLSVQKPSSSRTEAGKRSQRMMDLQMELQNCEQRLFHGTVALKDSRRILLKQGLVARVRSMVDTCDTMAICGRHVLDILDCLDDKTRTDQRRPYYGHLTTAKIIDEANSDLSTHFSGTFPKRYRPGFIIRNMDPRLSNDTPAARMRANPPPMTSPPQQQPGQFIPPGSAGSQRPPPQHQYGSPVQGHSPAPSLSPNPPWQQQFRPQQQSPPQQFQQQSPPLGQQFPGQQQYQPRPPFQSYQQQPYQSQPYQQSQYGYSQQSLNQSLPSVPQQSPINMYSPQILPSRTSSISAQSQVSNSTAPSAGRSDSLISMQHPRSDSITSTQHPRSDSLTSSIVDSPLQRTTSTLQDIRLTSPVQEETTPSLAVSGASSMNEEEPRNSQELPPPSYAAIGGPSTSSFPTDSKQPLDVTRNDSLMSQHGESSRSRTPANDEKRRLEEAINAGTIPYGEPSASSMTPTSDEKRMLEEAINAGTIPYSQGPPTLIPTPDDKRPLEEAMNASAFPYAQTSQQGTSSAPQYNDEKRPLEEAINAGTIPYSAMADSSQAGVQRSQSEMHSSASGSYMMPDAEHYRSASQGHAPKLPSLSLPSFQPFDLGGGSQFPSKQPFDDRPPVTSSPVMGRSPPPNVIVQAPQTYQPNVYASQAPPISPSPYGSLPYMQAGQNQGSQYAPPRRTSPTYTPPTNGHPPLSSVYPVSSRGSSPTSFPQPNQPPRATSAEGVTRRPPLEDTGPRPRTFVLMNPDNDDTSPGFNPNAVSDQKR